MGEWVHMQKNRQHPCQGNTSTLQGIDKSRYVSCRPETPIHGVVLERNRKMRFSDSRIFKGLLPLKMAAHPCAALVSVLSGRKPS
jgi:hypothetical protein